MREIEPNRGEGRALCPHSSPNWLFPQILVILAQFNHRIALLSGVCGGMGWWRYLHEKIIVWLQIYKFCQIKKKYKSRYFIKDGHNVLSPNPQLGQLDVSDVCWTVELQTWSDKIRGAAAASRALRSSFLSSRGGGAQQLSRTKNFVASTLVIRNAAGH